MSTHSTDRSRQPKGIPVGGQYAASEKTEAVLNLMGFPPAAEKDYGDVTNVREGSRTPWGKAQYASHLAPGIVSVGCAGHGGIKLSPERNAEIPPALRNKSGWYEEDRESYIVSMVHPEAAPPTWDPRESTASDENYGDMTREQAISDHAESAVIDWFPDAYEKATGKTVTPAMSSTRAEQARQADKEEFRAEHADEFVTLGNGDNHADWLPEGYAACKARLDATGEERTFLMPMHEVVTNHSYGRNALVNPNRHLDVTDVVNAKPERPWTHAITNVPIQRGDDLCIDTNGLTPAQRRRARSELEKVWRFQDGDSLVTESLGEHMKRVGVTGKKPYADGDKVTYSVQYEGSRVTTVSKATYDALTSVPDVSDEEQQAYVAKERARVRYEKAKASTYGGLDTKGIAKRQAAEEDYKAAVATDKTLSDAKSDRARAWQAERDQIQADTFTRLTAEKGLSFEA